MARISRAFFFQEINLTTIALTHPVAHGPMVINALNFRKPGFGDMELLRRVSTGDDMDALCALVARLSGIPLAAAEAIDLNDITTITAAVAEHLEKHVGTYNGQSSQPAATWVN